MWEVDSNTDPEIRQYGDREIGRDVRAAMARPALWGCGGLLIGLAIGGLLMLLGLIALAPRPRVASPGSLSYGNLSITMDDAYLTNAVSSAVSKSSSPIKLSDVQAEIQPGNTVKISAFTSGSWPLSAQLTAVAQLRVENGTLALHIASAQIGGLPLPASIDAALEQAMNQKLAQVSGVLLPPGYHVVAINTTEHHLQMTIAQA